MIPARLWPATGLRSIILKRGKRIKHLWFEADAPVPEAEVRAAAEDGWDVFFAPASYSAPRRKQAHVAEIRAFWLDLDAGPGKPYPDWQAALRGLVAWIRAQRFHPPSVVVRSGAGLHVFWALEQSVPGEQWTAIAQRFHRALQVTGLAVDASRTSDSASMLRVPETWNYKYETRLPVEVLLADGPVVSLAAFEAAIPRVGPRPVPDISGKKSASPFAVEEPFPPAHAEPIAAGCAQMSYIQAKGGAVEEPLWRAALSILWRCDGAKTLIHDWSRGDPRYDPRETTEKARLTAGPATCEYFQTLAPARCQGCRYAGKIRSPIVLGTELPAPRRRPDDPGSVRRLDRVGPFQVSSKGVFWAGVEEESGAPLRAQVTHCPLWVEEVRERARAEDQADASSLMLHWHAVDGSNKRAIMRQAEVYDARNFVRWLADHNMISQVVNRKLLMQYIQDYTLELVRRAEVRKYHDALGWYESTFVLGPVAISAKGPAPALIQAANPIRNIRARGTLAGWIDATAPLAAQHLWPHAFALLAGFGSALLSCAETPLTSAVVSLAGPSGAGKTCAARAALSIYAPADHISQSATATANAVRDQLSSNRHVPFLLDEVTGLPPKLLAQFIYEAANGQAKRRLNARGEAQLQEPWALVPFVTSNHPLLDYQMQDMEEAHRRRILEISFQHPLDPAVGASLVQADKSHGGAPAATYLQAVCAIRAALPALIQQAETRVRKTAKVPDVNRFGLWTLAVALVGGGIARKAGLISFDPEPVVLNAAAALATNVTTIQAETDRFVNEVKELVTFRSDQVCHWASGSDINPLGMAENLPREPIARYDRAGRMLYVPQTILMEHMLEKRISMSNIRTWLKDHAVERGPFRIAPRTPPVYCYKLDCARLGIDMEGAA